MMTDDTLIREKPNKAHQFISVACNNVQKDEVVFCVLGYDPSGKFALILALSCVGSPHCTRIRACGISEDNSSLLYINDLFFFSSFCSYTHVTSYDGITVV